jgi:hypothetical protein
VSTVPEAVTVSPVSEVAPASVHELNLSTVSVPLVTVITGAVVSSTVTVLVTAVAAFPEESVTL